MAKAKRTAKSTKKKSTSIASAESKILISVLGDILIETGMFDVTTSTSFQTESENENTSKFWPPRKRWTLVPFDSGAFRIVEMLKAATSKLPNVTVVSMADSANWSSGSQSKLRARMTSQGTFLDSLVEFSLSDEGNAPKVYRVSRRIGATQYGLGKSSFNEAEVQSINEECVDEVVSSLSPKTERIACTVINDAAVGFRGVPFENYQSSLDRSNAIVWKTESPLGDGNLWAGFAGSSSLPNKTVQIVKEECIRHYGVNIREEGSFERAVSEVAANFVAKSEYTKILAANYVVITFPPHGVFLIDRKKDNISVFRIKEGRFKAAESSSGGTYGFDSILTAAIAKSFAWHQIGKSRFEIRSAIVAGIAHGIGMWQIHAKHGYGESSITGPNTFSDCPFKRLFSSRQKIKEISIGYSVVENVASDHKEWSRLDAYKRPNSSQPIDLAIQIVQKGLDNLVSEETKNGKKFEGRNLPSWVPRIESQAPFASFGSLKSSNRNEIDVFSSLTTIARTYLKTKNWKSPLCYGVFGPPGSGKNFALKELMGTVDSKFIDNALEFNVAQFTQLSDLVSAFHQAQDRVLQGETPLVVFDEFDCSMGSEPLGWLKFFLAPMEDGQFKHGERMYKIGKAIFVFAGGVKTSFSDFTSTRDADTFKKAKGPDFVSRLRGHLDIPSIKHPRLSGDEELSESVLFRRAMIMRSILERELGSIVNETNKVAEINEDVIRAFLKIREFKHDVRSMKAILQMSSVSTHRARLNKASLPTSKQLAMHVDADKFFELLDPK